MRRPGKIRAGWRQAGKVCSNREPGIARIVLAGHATAITSRRSKRLAFEGARAFRHCLLSPELCGRSIAAEAAEPVLLLTLIYQIPLSSQSVEDHTPMLGLDP